MSAREFQSKGVVVTVGTEIKTKTFSNGGTGTYVACTVKHTDGPMKGMTYFAQRTLTNSEGQTKENVKVGEEVGLYNRISDDNKTVFSAISKGAQVDNIEDIMASLLAGVEVDTQAIS